MAPHDVIAINWHAAGLAELHRWAEAQAVIRKAIERNPAETKPYYQLGKILIDDDCFSEAIECFDIVLDRAPQHPQALEWRITALRELRRFSEAEEAAAEAIERRPDDPDMHTAAAEVASGQDHYDEAVSRVERALAIDPRDSWALRSRMDFLRLARRFEEAEQAAAEAIERRPDDPDVHTDAAWVASDQDREDEAVSRVERALAIDPRDSGALRSRMDFLRWARRFSEAEEAAAEAIERRPDDPDVHTAAAEVASGQDHYDLAVSRVERALAIDPRDSGALRSRMDFLRLARRFSEAEEAAAEAIERRPDDPDVHTAAAEVASGQDHYDEAVSRVERALAIDPRDSGALRSRMDFLRLARRFSEAEEAAAEAIERRPDDPDVHTAAAEVASGQDHYDLAVSRVERALAIDPRDSGALRSRMDFLRWARRFSEAEEAAAEAIERRPDDPDVHTAAAWVASDQDREDEAVSRVERALAIDPRDSWALRSRMDFLRAARRFSEAEEAAAEAIKRRPDDPDMHTAAAWIASGQDHYDLAVSRVERALAIAPRHSRALRSRISILRAARWFEEAEQAAAEAIKRRPDDPDMHTTAAWVASGQDHYDEAVSRVERALAIDPRHSRALRSRISILRAARWFEEAEQAAAEAIERRPDDPDMHTDAAWVASGQDHYDEAVSRVERALAIDPRHSRALRSRISILRAARWFEEAEQAAAEAIERRPDDPDMHTDAAWVASDQDHYDEAVSRVERALAIDPRHSRALRSRISILRAARWFEEAEQAAAEAIERRPDDPDMHTDAAWVASDQDHYDEAVSRVERALAIDPRDSWALRSRMDFLRLARRFEEAEQAAAEAIERRPDDPDVHTDAAWVASDQDREDEAVSRVERALAIDPRDSWALRSRMDFLRWARRFSEAEEAAAEAIERRPDDPDVHTAAAEVASGQDHYDEAVSRVERALAIDPRDSGALRSRMDFLRWARRFSEAEEAAAEAIERRPDDPDVHTAAAEVASGQDHYDLAVSRVERALAIDPRDSGALRSRMDFLRLARRFSEAEEAAAEAIERRPDDPDVHTAAAEVASGQDHYDEAVSRVERALAIDPRDSGALRSRMDFLRLARRFSEAEEAAAEAIERRPDDPDVHTAAAEVASGQDHYDLAVSRVERALAIDPRDSWALRSRMDFLRWARRFSEAEEAAAEAIERRPDDPDVHTAAAWVASDQDREDEAVSRVERALAIDPRDSWALRSRMDFLRAARRFSEAEEAAAEAIKRRPDDPDMHTAAAWIASGQDHYDEAVSRVERALAIAPRDSWALRSRISILRAARWFEEAEQAAAEAIKRRPDDPDMHTAAAWVASGQDHYDEAVSRVERALAIAPRDSWALRSRISILRLARRFEEAEQAAAEAIELSPNDFGIRVELGRMNDDRRDFEPALLCFAIVLARDPDHVEANVAKSAVLRSMRRCKEAQREIARLSQLKPKVGELKFELGQIHHDERRLVEARKIFRDLLDTAANADERAEAHHSLGWVAFTETDFITAEQEFRAAIEQQPDDLDYELALAWALARQVGKRRQEEAEQIATKVVERRPDPSAHVCLGVLAFKRGGLAASEYHLNQALQIDPWYGSHTDLGALYSHIGRYNDAESELQKAVARDWYDMMAHVELGRLFLQLDEQRLPDAEREFRQALACDPASSSAAIGLAQALEKAGDEIAAESTLRQALRRQEPGDTWRTYLALARLLVQRGDKQQNPDLLADAYAQAQRAISLAPDAEADPHFVAGVALYRLGSLSVDARGRLGYRRRAMNHLRECVKRDEGHADAQRNLRLLEREMKVTAPAVWGGYAVAGVSLTLLTAMWVMFFLTTKVTAVLLSVTTPVLVGLFTIATLLPTLIRLRLPGFEADLQAGTGMSTPGPTGDVAFSPGRFSAPTGPTGQPPRHK